MLAPREYEEPFNKSPVIRAVSALMLVIFTLASLTRVSTRLIALGLVKTDDILIMIATAFAVSQSVVVILQGANSFGQQMETLSPSQIDGILKRQYASEILFILTLTLAKFSASRTLSDLAPPTRRTYIWVTEGVIGVWSLSSVLTVCFQCGGTTPWDYVNGQCLNRAALWTYIDILNIVSDIMLTAILVELIKDLQIKSPRRILVLGLFSSRLLTVPPIACHIVLFRIAATSTDPTFDMWRTVIVAQVIQCLSVVATCTPFLKPLMDALDSGGWIMGDLRQTEAGSSRTRTRDTPGYANSGRKMGNSKGGVTFSGRLRSESYKAFGTRDDDVSQASGDRNEGLTTATATSGDKPSSWNQGSETSQTVLVETSWSLRVEGDGVAQTVT